MSQYVITNIVHYKSLAEARAREITMIGWIQVILVEQKS